MAKAKRKARGTWSLAAAAAAVTTPWSVADQAGPQHNRSREQGAGTLDGPQPSWNDCFGCMFSYCKSYTGPASDGICPPDLGRGMLRRGLYVYQLQWWLQHFPAEQLLVINHDQLVREPEVVLDRVVSFLGQNPNEKKPRQTDKPMGFSAPSVVTLDEEDARYAQGLYSYYSHANQELYRLLESMGPASGWTGTFPTSRRQQPNV